jgi:hypothetical protein
MNYVIPSTEIKPSSLLRQQGHHRRYSAFNLLEDHEKGIEAADNVLFMRANNISERLLSGESINCVESMFICFDAESVSARRLYPGSGIEVKIIFHVVL